MPETLKFGAMLNAIPWIASKAPLTFFILAASVLIGLSLGFLMAMARIYRIRILDRVCAACVTLIRGTPAIILLYIAYYALPQIMQFLGFQIRTIPRAACVICALGINSSAFFSEIIRNAIENVGKGQSEAAYSIGMTRTQALFRILLPQAQIKALPNAANTILTLFKETALGFYIGLVDIMGQAKIFAVTRYLFFEMYLAAALLYWILCSLMGLGFRLLEKRSCKEARTDVCPYIDF